ncbi:MAG: response regulator, partial [Alphaproteobacteria bacterium]|nr:response regulator [Alphaproteobacteria bacterium]
GYQVVEAEDGPSALTFLKLQAPDLVITDLMMPGGMNGAELARQAKNQHPDLGFIFISGYADAANKVAADLDQGVRVLGKPFSQEDLAAALRDVLDEQRGG